MGLDPVHHDDSVGLGRKRVDLHRQPVLRGSDHLGPGANTKGTSHGLLGDAVTCQNLRLTLHRRAAVAAHGGDDKRLCTDLFQFVHDGSDDQLVIGDAPASHAHRDAFSRFQPLCDLRPFKLRQHGGLHVLDPGPREALFHPHHFGYCNLL